jgi:hypothetical protein
MKRYDAHGHSHGGVGMHAAHGPEPSTPMRMESTVDLEAGVNVDVPGVPGMAKPVPVNLAVAHLSSPSSSSVNHNEQTQAPYRDDEHDPSHGQHQPEHPNANDNHGNGHGHGHGHGHDHGHGHGDSYEEEREGILSSSSFAQILSVVILEFGVVFHSFIIGMTLSVSTEFIPLLVVLTFHQLFEGLGLGTRLAHLTFGPKSTPVVIVTSPTSAKADGDSKSRDLMSEQALKTKEKGSKSSSPLPEIQTHQHSHSHSHSHSHGHSHSKLSSFPWLGALAFALTTPLGVAIGLALRGSYSPNTATANIVSGVFDSFSSGILLYTGLVELLAHEFLFSKAMREEKTSKVVYASLCVLLGAGVMALLGRWA